MTPRRPIRRHLGVSVVALSVLCACLAGGPIVQAEPPPKPDLVVGHFVIGLHLHLGEWTYTDKLGGGYCYASTTETEQGGGYSASFTNVSIPFESGKVGGDSGHGTTSGGGWTEDGTQFLGSDAGAACDQALQPVNCRGPLDLVDPDDDPATPVELSYEIRGRAVRLIASTGAFDEADSDSCNLNPQGEDIGFGLADATRQFSVAYGSISLERLVAMKVSRSRFVTVKLKPAYGRAAQCDPGGDGGSCHWTATGETASLFVFRRG
jgi:hypothetical protein